ncbi:hypothetical protein ACQZV8_02210 [Magnetococcales bacterium HHB-1]
MERSNTREYFLMESVSGRKRDFFGQLTVKVLAAVYVGGAYGVIMVSVVYALGLLK